MANREEFSVMLSRTFRESDYDLNYHDSRRQAEWDGKLPEFDLEHPALIIYSLWSRGKNDQIAISPLNKCESVELHTTFIPDGSGRDNLYDFHWRQMCKGLDIRGPQIISVYRTRLSHIKRGDGLLFGENYAKKGFEVIGLQFSPNFVIPTGLSYVSSGKVDDVKEIVDREIQRLQTLKGTLLRI